MNTEEKKQCILMIIADLVGSGIKELIKEVLRTIILQATSCERCAVK